MSNKFAEFYKIDISQHTEKKVNIPIYRGRMHGNSLKNNMKMQVLLCMNITMRRS